MNKAAFITARENLVVMVSEVKEGLKETQESLDLIVENRDLLAESINSL